MFDLLAGLFLVALLYILVRPQSGGAELIRAVGDAMTAIVSNAADLAGPEANEG
jgi:hypothetical protein